VELDVTVRRCAGPAGEPGYAAEIDGTVGECHTYDPENRLSQVSAMMAVEREHEDAAAAKQAAG
jgi:hypothetical protein